MTSMLHAPGMRIEKGKETGFVMIWASRLTILFLLLGFVLVGCGDDSLVYTSVQVGEPFAFDVDTTDLAYTVNVGRSDGPFQKLRVALLDPEGRLVDRSVDRARKRIRTFKFIPVQTGSYQVRTAFNTSVSSGVGYVTVEVTKGD